MTEKVLTTQRGQLEEARAILTSILPWLAALDGITEYKLAAQPNSYTNVTITFSLSPFEEADRRFMDLAPARLSGLAQNASVNAVQLLRWPVPPDPLPEVQIVEKLVDGPAFEIQRRERRTVGEKQ